MILSDVRQLYIPSFIWVAAVFNILLFMEHKFELTFCSTEFCFLRTKNLILHGFLPDSVVAFFTSQVHNTEHLLNLCFSPKMCLIIQLEGNSFSLPFKNFPYFSQSSYLSASRLEAHEIYYTDHYKGQILGSLSFFSNLNCKTKMQTYLQPNPENTLNSRLK